jgi:predicted 3-demethylubiquinone-9 3-methyltransferase (glyoxalase superfamily)
MTKKFDITKKRENLLTFGFQYASKKDLEESRNERVLASFGRGMITTAIYALVCGFRKEGADLLRKAETFLGQSLQQIDREVVHQIGGKYNAYLSYALARGMNTNVVNAANFTRAFESYKEEAKEDLRTDREVHALSLARYMEMAWFAQAYNEATKFYESVKPDRASDSGTLAIRTISDLVYHLCRQRQGALTVSDQKLAQAQAKFLEGSVEEALARGLALDAFISCKIAYPYADLDTLIEKLVSHVPSTSALSH